MGDIDLYGKIMGAKCYVVPTEFKVDEADMDFNDYGLDFDALWWLAPFIYPIGKLDDELSFDSIAVVGEELIGEMQNCKSVIQKTITTKIKINDTLIDCCLYLFENRYGMTSGWVCYKDDSEEIKEKAYLCSLNHIMETRRI